MLYLLYRIGFFIIRNTTTKTAYRIVGFFAKLRYIFSIRDREIVKANLRNVVPGAGEKTIALYAEEVFKNFTKYLIDFFSQIKNQKDYLKKTVRFIGIENLDEALKPGKGCIIVSGHFGNWELTACAVANLGYKLNVIALAHADSRINSLFREQRERTGIKVAHIGSAKTIFQRALSQGELIAILGDRPFGDRGTKIRFFGKTAVFARGAALLSLKNNSPIIMCFSYKEDANKNQHTIIFEKPILLKREGRLDKQLNNITQSFADRFEYYIRRYPSQWYMFNKVWD